MPCVVFSGYAITKRPIRQGKPQDGLATERAPVDSRKILFKKRGLPNGAVSALQGGKKVSPGPMKGGKKMSDSLLKENSGFQKKMMFFFGDAGKIRDE